MSTKTRRRLLYCDVACCRHIQLSVTTDAAATAAATAAAAAAADGADGAADAAATAAAVAAADGADGSGCGGVKACVGRISCNGNNIALQSWLSSSTSQKTPRSVSLCCFTPPPVRDRRFLVDDDDADNENDNVNLVYLRLTQLASFLLVCCLHGLHCVK